MLTPSPSTSGDYDNFERVCTICGRPAFCRYYGAVSCEACKMFFRRMIVEKLSYKCKKINNCYVTSSGSPLKCRACRFKRCLQLGMKLPPSNYTALELRNQKDDELNQLIKSLKRSEVTPVEWSFSAIYSVLNLFRSFDFIEQLDAKDKKLLFQFNTFRSNVLCGGMRALKDQRDKMVTPSGQEIFPDILVTKFNASAELINRVCCQVVARLIELKVTDEEFVLLNLIFFCNTPDSLSDAAKSILSSRQKFYVSVLFQYCQLTYQKSAPSRLNDLLSVYHVIQKNTSEMQYIGIMIQGFIPNFPIKKLVSDTYMLGAINK
ncbi:CRE-NHR-171 protein [Caenorhabditis remanei]|uniref:CRE-NHR-171 protein n=1 Tax=Caenorhabditis remanei TaxID=31234 RepID=E3M032_CAERE|nr:CRE-NHR-171 protein [Caenorhabditis remanei]